MVFIAGFDNVNVGCCGTGYLEASFLCNPTSYVCTDPSKYLFWDSIHPTGEAYHKLFDSSRSTIDLIMIGGDGKLLINLSCSNNVHWRHLFWGIPLYVLFVVFY
jgi:hypothetical protein